MTYHFSERRRNRAYRANGLFPSLGRIVSLCLLVAGAVMAALAVGAEPSGPLSEMGADRRLAASAAVEAADAAGNGAAAAAEEILRFRYWMVPSDRIDEWPWGPEKYYPISGVDFEKWMDDFRRKERTPSDASSSTPLSRFRLTARLEDGVLVDGRAWAAFDAVKPEAPPFLFDPCSFSVTDFLWDDGQKASVGLYPDGLIYLAHPKRGTLSFRWSQAGTKNAAGDDQFDLAFVASPATDLTLEIPENLRPRVSVGAVRQLDQGAEPGFLRWQICPGANRRVRLTISPVAATAQIQEKIGYRQELSCRMAEEGMDQVAKFIFDRGDRFTGEWTVILDQPLLPTAVEWKNPKAPAEIVSRVSSFGTTKLQIRLPEGVSADALELQVSAFCPNRAGNHRRLPGIRLLSDGVFWKETVLRLTVVRPLVATGFETFESVRTFDRFAARQSGQETFTFKYFEPNAGLALLLSESTPALSFDSAHEISFDPQEIRVRSELLITSDVAGAMKFSLDLAPNWEIETVKDLGGGSLNWAALRGAEPGRGDAAEHDRIEVSLRRPIPTDEPLRLELTGRYLGEIGERMPVDALIPIDLSSRLRGEHWAAFVSSGPYRVRRIDADGRPVTSVEADETAARELFSKPFTTAPIRFGNESSGLYVRLDKAVPAYSGALSGKITVRSETLVEEWKVLCTPPTAGRVERVFLAFYDSGGPLPDETEWKWSITGETDRAFQVTRLSEEDRRGLGLSVRAYVWEIRPNASRSVPFEIQAARTRPIRSEERIPLACLPEAEHQTAEVVIASENPVPPIISTRKVRSTLTALPPSGEYETKLGAFRYEPLELRSRGDVPEIALQERIGEVISAVSNAWCWFLRLDSQFEPSGTVRNYMTAFIENSGHQELNITLPEGLGVEAVHAVWADSERLTWYPQTHRGRTVLRVVLPAKRRYITVSLEYHYAHSPLSVRQNLVPRLPELDIKTLSGDWNAWFPPEYTAGLAMSESFSPRPLWDDLKRDAFADEGETPTWRQRLESLWPFGRQARYEGYKKFAVEFLERLGDPSVLSTILDFKRQNPSVSGAPSGSATGVASGSASDSAAVTPAGRSGPASGTTPAGAAAATLTWGDLFARPESLTALFPSITADRALRVFINRSALSRSRILPSDPVVLPDAPTPLARALGLMEHSGVVILFLRPDLIYVTSAQERQELGDDVVPLGNDRFWYLRDPVRLHAILNALEPGASPHIVSAVDWNAGALGIVNPWQLDLYSAGFPLITPGWNRCRVTLDESADGVVVLNRYRLAARKWFFFLLVIALTWRGPLSRPTFLIGLFGVSVALFGFVSPTGASVLYGITLGTLCSFGFSLLNAKKPPTPELVVPEPPVEESEPGFVLLNQIPSVRAAEGSAHSDPFFAKPSPSDVLFAPKPNAASDQEDAGDAKEEGSTEVFPYYHNVTPDEKKALVEDVTDELNAADLAEYFSEKVDESAGTCETPNERSDKTPNERSDKTPDEKANETPDEKANETPAEKANETPDKTTAEKPNETPDASSDGGKESGRCRLGLLLAMALAWGLVSAFCWDGERFFGAEADSPAADEPARVFFPYGDDRRPLRDDYVWVPESLHNKLSELIAGQENLENPWRMTSAFYEGTVNYNAFTQTVSLFHLKATYTVVLETSRAVIRLPMMALPPDGGAKFDRQPIYPLFHRNELVFDISGSTPGEHTLELTLTPPLFDTGTEQGVHIDIPRVPDAKLELRLPPDAPPIRVNGAHGSVRLGADLLAVRLGPTDRIVLEREEELGKIGAAQVEVEQLFQLRARPSQTSLSARFRFRVSGGKVQTLYLQNDPRYFLAQCSCDEPGLEPSIQRESRQGDLIRVSFKKPVSGVVTLRAEYVVRDFSGIGQIRLPRIRAARARITRSWLALFETPTIEFVKLFPSDVAVGTFQNLWEGDETPLAVYDLTEPDPAWTASIRLKMPRQSVRERLSYRFDAASTFVDYTADYRTDGDVFRLSFRVPEIFEPETVTLTDAAGAQVESPERYREKGRLHLFFPTPLMGEYRLHLTGRMKTPIDREVPFEPLAMEDVPGEPIPFEIFRDARVRVRLKNVSDWSEDSGQRATAQIDGRQALFVGNGQLADAGAFDGVRLLVQSNLPKIGGQIRTVLFNRTNDHWEILSDFFLNVERGIVDHFEIELDELCVGPVTVEPTISYRLEARGKGQTLTILPNKPVEGTFAFRIRTPIQRSGESLRLPRVALTAPAAEIGPTFQARFFLPAVDGLRQRYLWTVENMRLYDPDAPSDVHGAADSENRLTPAVSALAAAAPAVETPFRALEDFPAVVTQLSGLASEDFVAYEATGPDWHAVFSAGRSLAQVSGAETNFFIRHDGSVYGETVMDARLGGSDAYELLLAKRAIPLSVTVDGVPTPAEQLTPGVWRLATERQTVGRRLAILFYVPPEENFRRRTVSARGNYTRFELVPATLAQIPTLSSYWTAVFESDESTDESGAPCYVTQIDADEPQDPPLPSALPPSDPIIYRNEINAWKIPVDYAVALPVLTRFSMEKMKHLLDLLELTVNDTKTDDPEMRLWFTRWFTRWQKCRNEVQTQFASQKTPLPFTERQKAAIFQRFNEENDSPGDPLLSRSEQMADDAFRKTLLLREATEQDYLDLMARFERIVAEAQLGPFVETLPADGFFVPSTLSLWQLNHRNSRSRFLIGLTNAEIKKITVDRFNVTRHFLLQRVVVSFLWLFGTGLLIYALRSFGFRAALMKNFDLIGLFFGTLLAVLRPGFVGWTVILAMLVVRFFRMRRRVKEPLPDASRSPSGDIVVMEGSENTEDVSFHPPAK